MINNKILLAFIFGLIFVGGVLIFIFLNNTNVSKNISPPAKYDPGAAQGKKLTENIDTITLTSTGFEPKKVTVDKKKYIIWVNKTGSETAIKSDSYAPLNLGRFPNNSSVQIIFDKAGTYNYYNELNPSQTGTVIVK